MAERLLDNQHYLAIEVWKDEGHLFTLDEPAGRTAPTARSTWAYRKRNESSAERKSR